MNLRKLVSVFHVTKPNTMYGLRLYLSVRMNVGGHLWPIERTTWNTKQKIWAIK